MLLPASDADVHGNIIRGLRRHRPGIDLVRTQDIGPASRPDTEVLVWAASEARILITNDRETMIGFAYQRVKNGEPMPGLIVTSKDQLIGEASEDILLIAECLSEDEIASRVIYLPYRG